MRDHQGIVYYEIDPSECAVSGQSFVIVVVVSSYYAHDLIFVRLLIIFELPACLGITPWIQNWSPLGYDRSVELFQRHFYDHSHVFRVVPGFLTQFGISYTDDSELQSFARRPIKDDPKKTNPQIQFEPGIVSFAGSGPNSRTSQLFISYGSSKSLGTQPWETPIGKVVEGMESTVTKFYSYGDISPFGNGPSRKNFLLYVLMKSLSHSHKDYIIVSFLQFYEIEANIHGHPEYIETLFPLTDKFVECHVSRIEGGQFGGKLELVENEQPERQIHLRKQKQLDPRHRDMRNPDMFQAQSKLIKEHGNTSSPTSVMVTEAFVVVLLLGIVYGLLKGRTKVLSKTSWAG